MLASQKQQKMVHDNDELTTIPRKLSYASSAGEDQTTVGSKAGIFALEQYKSSSPVIPSISDDDKLPIFPFPLRQIYKNLLLISLAFTLLFTAYNGLSTLQSSLNVKNNVGVNSLLITYAFLIVSSSNNMNV